MVREPSNIVIPEINIKKGASCPQFYSLSYTL